MNTLKFGFTLMAIGAVLTSALADRRGQVYVQTNDPANNQVLVFGYGDNGVLSSNGGYSTGGTGVGGAGLGSQGAIAVDQSGEMLFAVDAGSNDIAAFRIDGAKLHKIGNFPSGGTNPVSITVHGNLLYVVNAGGTPNIAGFRIGGQGKLVPISLSSRPLSSPTAAPAEIKFNPSGDALVVTEKSTNTIDTWPMFGDRPGFLYTNASNGSVPFGFDFDRSGDLLVSEAAASAASSYSLGQAGWESISASVLNGQKAACWLSASPNGKFAYTANAGNGTISGYYVSGGGELSLLNPSGLNATIGAGTHPVDLGFSRNGDFLYVLANGNGTIAEYRVKGDGSLQAIGTIAGVPTTAQGLASR